MSDRMFTKSKLAPPLRYTNLSGGKNLQDQKYDNSVVELVVCVDLSADSLRALEHLLTIYETLKNYLITEQGASMCYAEELARKALMKLESSQCNETWCLFTGTKE